MEDSSKKINKRKTNHSVSVPENLEKVIKKQNVDDNLNSNSKIINNIKSKYIIKIIFSYLDEKIKLKSIKYNKKLQNLFNINIINYKFFNGKFIEYESNGKGKEYNYNSTLLFEGEYLNGERNGKGKEYYYNGKLKFEGEYLNGEKNGKGKEYDFWFGKLKFEGEYLKGKRNGKGKNYYKSKQLLFEGEYLYGYILRGKSYINGRLEYEGEYKRGQPNGFGKEYYLDGSLFFEGEYFYGRKWKGKGYDMKGNIIYFTFYSNSV